MTDAKETTPSFTVDQTLMDKLIDDLMNVITHFFDHTIGESDTATKSFYAFKLASLIAANIMSAPLKSIQNHDPLEAASHFVGQHAMELLDYLKKIF